LQVYKKLQNWRDTLIIFPAGFTGWGALNKDPTVWLDGDRLPAKKVKINKKLPNNFVEKKWNFHDEFIDKLFGIRKFPKKIERRIV
jgi:hypothetical protein